MNQTILGDFDSIQPLIKISKIRNTRVSSSLFTRVKIAFPTSSINVEDVFCLFYRMLMNGEHSDADAVAINIISIASSRDWSYAIFFSLEHDAEETRTRCLACTRVLYGN